MQHIHLHISKQLALMYSDKIWGRMDAGRRNQYKEGSNTQPLVEQQRRQQWACCSPSCNPCWDPRWGQQLSLAHASVNSSSPTIFSLQTLKHASMAAQTLPETSHFCTRPCPQCCWHWSSAAVEKKKEDRTHIYLSLLGEGAESAHGRTGEAPRPGQSMRWELAAAGDEMQQTRVRPGRMSPSPPHIRSPLATFHILLE